MSIAVLSLLCLVIVVALGYIKDLNVGVLAIIASFVLVLVGGLDMDLVLDGFPSSLFLNLLGTMYLFALLQENGTLSLGGSEEVGTAPWNQLRGLVVDTLWKATLAPSVMVS